MAVRSGLQSYTFLLSVNLHFTLVRVLPRESIAHSPQAVRDS